MSDAVRLRDVTEADLPVLFEQQLDPEAVSMANFPSRDRDAFFAHWEGILSNDALVKKAILVGGAVAGNVVSGRPRPSGSSVTGSGRSSGGGVLRPAL